jgi:hydroxymethylpyrimidine pyrophosphatase-like HAD family hydrolase
MRNKGKGSRDESLRKPIGCLALDIDGTLTDDPHHLPQSVRILLEDLYHQGWELLFVTGRTFALGNIPLEALRVPYCIAAQHGSILLSMPNREVLGSWNLPIIMASHLEKQAMERGLACVAYAGYQKKDAAYYRPKTMGQDHRDQIAYLATFGAEPWIPIDRWSEFPGDDVSLFKLFGKEEACSNLLQELQSFSQWHVNQIQDPFHSTFALLLLTHPLANKGHALRSLIEVRGLEGLPTIAAGNDSNDLPLLREAQWKIAMEGSPPSLLEIADQIAPPCKREGIIPALLEATKRRLSHEYRTQYS